MSRLLESNTTATGGLIDEAQSPRAVSGRHLPALDGVRATPSPLAHTWSLAIEEQFYLLPVLIVGLVTWSTEHWRRLGLELCVAGHPTK